MIIHAGEETFILSDFKIDSTFLSGNLSKIDSSWYFYKENNSKTRFKNKEKEITKEVHFYLKEERINPAYTEIPLNNIKEIHVIFYDNEKSFVRSMVAVEVLLHYHTRNSLWRFYSVLWGVRLKYLWTSFL
ncbi:MAG: hypothetical protein IPL63_18015 [Saprospiraceae bacterium]|nr:hypothetical protein [Saprospiraceae bacterium]